MGSVKDIKSPQFNVNSVSMLSRYFELNDLLTFINSLISESFMLISFFLPFKINIIQSIKASINLEISSSFMQLNKNADCLIIYSDCLIWVSTSLNWALTSSLSVNLIPQITSTS